MTISELVNYIRDNYPFSDSSHPPFGKLDGGDRKFHELNHVHLHMSKSVGKIAAALEPLDHGESLDKEELRDNVVKEVINVLRMAELVGLSGEDIERMIREKYES